MVDVVWVCILFIGFFFGIVGDWICWFIEKLFFDFKNNKSGYQ